MKRIIPPHLKTGDTVRIIAPARSMALPWISKELLAIAQARLEMLGLKVTISKHAYELDEFNSSPIQSRVSDIHAAFSDPKVRLILTIMGGFNSNELLPYLDYELIRNNPKALCGYSDITALENGIFAKTGLVTYSGPHYFDFGEKKGFEHTLKYFKKCLCGKGPYQVQASKRWSGDRWGKDQEHRNFHKNPGFTTINAGYAKGTSLISNLVTFQSIIGSEFAPSLSGSILFIEEDHEESLVSFNRNLTSLTIQPDFNEVQGIVFGRFQPESNIGEKELRLIVNHNERLKKIPILAGVDFGHTTPRITFPIGGTAEISLRKDEQILRILDH